MSELEPRRSGEPKFFGSIMVPINCTEITATLRAKRRATNNIAVVESSPEKAGVGGSIPSLATMFSYLRIPACRFGSITVPIGSRSLDHF